MMGPQQHQLAAQSKRKEKARVAARARRSQEASIIMEMASELHITQEKMRRIDKATIVKLAIDYIKASEILCKCCSMGVLQLEPAVGAPLPAPAQMAVQPLQASPQQHQQPAPQPQPQPQPQAPLPHSAPKLSTALIFTPKTEENTNPHFLMIEQRTTRGSLGGARASGGARHEDDEGEEPRLSFVLKPDTEILEEDDLTHLAPSAGESISLEVEPLDGIQLDSDLFCSQPAAVGASAACGGGGGGGAPVHLPSSSHHLCSYADGGFGGGVRVAPAH